MGYSAELFRIKQAAKALNTFEDRENKFDSSTSLSEEQTPTLYSDELTISEEGAAEASGEQLNSEKQRGYEYIVPRIPTQTEVEFSHGTHKRNVAKRHRRHKRVVSRPNLSEICEYQNRHRPKRRRLCSLL